MSWSKIAVPAFAFLLGAGGTAAGFSLAGSGATIAPASAPHPSLAPTSSNGRGAGTTSGGSAMMGGMMGGGSVIARGAPGGLVPASRMLDLAARVARQTTRRGTTITYRSANVTLVALAAPGNRPGMYWQLDGIDGPDGPTVSVPARASISIDFADGDPGHAHGLELTTAGPPYSRMAMMQGSIASPGAFIMPVPPPEGNLWYATTVTFRAPQPGAYHLICPVPGHAKLGMWATFVVR